MRHNYEQKSKERIFGRNKKSGFATTKPGSLIRKQIPIKPTSGVKENPDL